MKRTLCLLVISCWGLVWSPPLMAQARSIQEFLQYQEKWEEFTLTEYDWHLEGRFALISGDQMTFTHCPLPILITEEMSRNRGNTGVVEVTGQIVRHNGKLAFRAKSLKSIPRDRDRLRNLRFGIDSTKPEEWYKVADWGHRRAAFYSDKVLEEDARNLDWNGVTTALRRLSLADEAGLEALVTTAREKQMDEELIQRILHDSLQAKRLSLQKQEWNPEAQQQLEKQVFEELPGSRTPLKTWPVDLQKQYTASPSQFYADAKEETRPTLNRIFAVSLLADRFRHETRPDGRNSFEIADRLRTEIPERADLLHDALKNGIRYFQSQVPTMTRSELDQFCQRLERENETLVLQDVKRKWLTAREPFYRQDGARGLADLAEQWLSLLQDQEQATKFYIDSWKANTEYTPATEWLTRHGMKLVNGNWMSAAELAAMPLSPIELAIRDGRVEIGMTRQQVLSALGGAPSSLTRSATSRGVQEWWEYDSAGVVIQFGRSRRQNETLVEKVELKIQQDVRDANAPKGSP